MEKAYFLLSDWLPVGAAVLVFFGIGLLMAKWIWGRHGLRLAQAADENVNLLNQWSSLGETQHVLFKKLRTRWQDDRDAWDEQSDIWKDRLSGKNQSIRKLIAEIKRLKEEQLGVDAKVESSNIEQLSVEIESLKKQLREVEDEREDAYAEMDDVRTAYLGKVSEVKSLEIDLLGRKDSEKDSADIADTNKQLSVLLRQRSVEMAKLRTHVVVSDAGNAEVLTAGAEEKEERREVTELMPQLELSANRGDEDLGGEVVDLMDELADVRRGYLSKAKEIVVLTGQSEELESIIEDRNQEVEDAGKELKVQLHTISNLRKQIAGLEGEIDGQDGESLDLGAELKEKVVETAFLNTRIKDLEESIADRYSEVNKVRARWSHLDTRAEEAAGRADKLDHDLGISDSEVSRLNAELDEKISELGPLGERMKEVEKQLNTTEEDATKLREELEAKTFSLTVAEEGALKLEESLAGQTEDLELAQSELTTLKGDLEERDEINDKRQTELKEAVLRLDEYDQDLSKKETNIIDMEEVVEQIEAEADSLKVLLDEGRRNTADLEAKIIEFEGLVDSKNSELGVFTSEIRNLVESVEGPDDEGGSDSGGDARGGGGRAVELDRLLQSESTDGAGKIHVRILNDAVADLQNRLTEAEGNYGACEREKVMMLQQTEGKRDDFELKLKTKDRQIQILKEEVSAQQRKLDKLRGHTTTSETEIASSTSRSETASNIVAAVESHGVRNTRPVTPSDEAPEPQEELGKNRKVSAHFEEKSAELKVSEISKIEEAARGIRHLGVSFKVSVNGFSAAEGSEDYNEFISARRADAVRELLIEAGIPQSIIAINARGTHPEYSATTNTWKARRVEIEFISVDASVLEVVG